MASLPLSSWSAESMQLLSPPPAQPQLVEPTARLSALEWSVVAMAEQDSVSSLREPGRFWSALNSMFGMSRPTPLANDRLEALRRVAVLAWRHRWNVPKSELRAFVAKGFSLEQYELLQASISKALASRRRRRGR